MHVEDLLIKVTSNMQGQVLEVANIDSLNIDSLCGNTLNQVQKNSSGNRKEGAPLIGGISVLNWTIVKCAVYHNGWPNLLKW